MWFLILLCSTLVLDEPYVHENPGFELRLPSDQWELNDQSQGGILALIFTPDEAMATRCSVLRFPASFLPDGLETREVQMQQAASNYQRVSLGPGTIAGRDATRWEYKIGPGTSIEWAFDDGGQVVVFQVAAPPTVWDDPEGKAQMEALAESFRWTGGEAPPPGNVDRTPPDQVRVRRALAATATSVRLFEVTRHSIEATFEPDEHSLDVQDTLELVSHQDDLAELRLYTTVVVVDDVTANVPLSWSVESIPNADALVIELEQPLMKGDTLTLEIHAASDDFIQRIDQELVAEIDVVGQVRSKSSWSSHVLWFPRDDVNDAVTDITFDVPAPMTAVSGGTLVETTERGDRRLFRYVEEYRIPRMLSMGFAVAEYVQAADTSDSGLNFTVYGFPGEEKRVEQRRQVLLECAAAFERALGPLPWSDVRFVHVTPESKETGVSTPGMILVSDFYFPDLEGVDASDGNLSDPAVLGLLVVADELSHQWNFYAARFPNELAEGVSTYTNALFVEVRHGAEAYARTIRYCRDTWVMGTGSEMEFAIANPRVNSNSRYRSVVFCKTPVVLDALRRRLGDEVFFDGFRRAFAHEDAGLDGFDQMQKGFEAASGQDLLPFFDQWFFRAGFPILKVEHEAKNGGVRVTVEQTQDEEPYAMAVEIQVTCEDGSQQVLPVELQDREQVFELELASPASEVSLGPEGRLPARVVK